MLRRGGGAILTDRTDLCEKLVWHTQHPYRHKRNLQLGLDNEYSLNMRIYPLAAVWANAAWDRALRQMEARQSRCLVAHDAPKLPAVLALESAEDFLRQPRRVGRFPVAVLLARVLLPHCDARLPVSI